MTPDMTNMTDAIITITTRDKEITWILRLAVTSHHHQIESQCAVVVREVEIVIAVETTAEILLVDQNLPATWQPMVTMIAIVIVSMKARGGK